MTLGKCDRKGRSMTERLLLYIQRKDGVTRKDMERYIWRMQGQPKSSKSALGPPGFFRYVQYTWTILGPIKRLRYRETWGTNLARLRNLDWIVQGPDKKWRVPPGTAIKAPFYNRRPSEPPPPRSEPYVPEYQEQSQMWGDLVEDTDGLV